MGNPYLEVVQAFRSNNFYVMTRIVNQTQIGLGPHGNRWHQVDLAFRRRVQRTLICPNFDLGVLFSADEAAGSLTQEETDRVQETTYEQMSDGAFKLPFPVTAWVHRSPNRDMVTVAFL